MRAAQGGSTPQSWCQSSVVLMWGDSSAELQVRGFLKSDSWLGTQSRLSLTTLPQACCVALLRLICKRGGNNACSVSEVGFCDKQVMLPSR